MFVEEIEILFSCKPFCNIIPNYCVTVNNPTAMLTVLTKEPN